MALTLPPTTSSSKGFPPSHSLYIRNLPEKLPKADLRRELYILFSTYGPVLDVTALKTAKMRGQAHVLFRETHSATQALRALRGFEVGGREMRIEYAKKRSDTLAKLTGTFGQPAPKTDAQSALPGAPSTFAAIPGAPGTSTSTSTATSGAPDTASTAATKAIEPPPAAAATVAVAGTKRPREEEGEVEGKPAKVVAAEAEVQGEEDEDEEMEVEEDGDEEDEDQEMEVEEDEDE
ncbi:hypothetical protein LTR56_004162 [Elasticomyces elasticus]|nr:hypothetical protein LTR22_015367 [Elasticomyces elasticus]KAK3654108.1 hypothetical protein LTR56_004162 [Elasticomyces elasticus]KAK4914686.1 hypothetical protein LTR49_017128 [Elasticomyces elasticus]KAK5753001.1 hypothetical protein LTS12_016877 [Elasticomyces elasticus]